jgi:hypothetical protein
MKTALALIGAIVVACWIFFAVLYAWAVLVAYLRHENTAAREDQ